MSEGRQPLDPTRRLLRTFGVAVSNFEERSAKLIERARAADTSTEERLAAAARLLREAALLNRRLREIADHVWELQHAALTQMSDLLVPASSEEDEESSAY
ncbi:hypothetical protein [Thermorudis peleae]|mgnify:CR=1 FL=1|uniref:hypothetical protein n=1 Tax=Thermorudis peleae TaxID=1382356 RepID=UPI000571D89F|nr:hypothetical protein [Thermorudis peleae]MBX6753016.1 hypothetical protein [Thermorudis peleae]